MNNHLLEVLNGKIMYENFNLSKPSPTPPLPTPYAGNRRCIPLALVGGVHVRWWGAVVRGRVVRGCWGVVCGRGGAGSCVV
jgi:hypothetical protein